MGCLRLFDGRLRSKSSKRRTEATAGAPAAPAAPSSSSAVVSAEARPRSTASAATASRCASFASSSSSANVSSEASGAARPPAASGSSGGSGSAGSSSARSIPELYEERRRGAGGGGLREFSLRELRAATRGFSPLLMVGEGGFGCVYRGVLRLPGGGGTPTPVAVKRLDPSGRQGHKEWLAEVHFLGVVEHRNLVRLIGYCASSQSQTTDRDPAAGPQRLLVYEFMPNKTLDDHLFNRAYPVLPWEVRLQIALGAAEGLLYLHEGLELQIIYRDFKASNVLLDEEFRPKLSDFGLAREGPSEGQTHVSTAVMGTFGYAAPDYVQTGHLTTKSDVWSFGVVLYEILTGRRSIERDRPRGEQKLLDWVRRRPPGEIVDARLEGRYPARGAAEVARLADACLAKHGRDRPTMRGVVEALRQAMRHTDMDGVLVAGADVDAAPAAAAAEDASAGAAVAVAAAEARKRRMLHLAALGGVAAGDAHARRRLMLMSAAATAAAAAPT